MKRIICIVLSVIFALILCSCSSAKPAVIETIDETNMIKEMFSDLSQKKFEEIASRSMLNDGTAVKVSDVQSIYDYIVKTGADPSLGFTIDALTKNVNINPLAETSNTYSIITLCGEKYVAFTITVERRSTGYFFTQISTLGVITKTETSDTETDTAVETDAADATAETDDAVVPDVVENDNAG